MDRISELILLRLRDIGDSFRDGLCFLENTLLWRDFKYRG